MKKSIYVIVIAIMGTILLGVNAVGLRVAAQTSDPVSMLLADYKWRSIGPAAAGGRVTDVEALDTDFRFAIAAAASGGVWKTTNAGTTWTPLFDHYGTSSIGDIAIFQRDPRILWVGTGEANNRNSVAWGDGIYKSSDGGKTFQNVGLKDTFQIARVVTHPANPDVVYAAAVGNLWGYTGDRGVFKTVDGGKTWQKLTNGLPHDGKTGATDLAMDPGNPEVLYAACYQRLRTPWRFDSGGPNGGIFKTADGGRTWKKLTNGLPAGATGRIGLAVYRKNPKIVMAIVEHGFQPARGSADYSDMTKLGTGIYRSEDGGKTWTNLSGGLAANQPVYVVEEDAKNPDLLFVGTEVGLQVSLDRGRTWRPMTNGLPTVAVYDIVIHPRDRDVIIGTHGRGIYILDDITALEEWRPALAAKPTHLFTQRPATIWQDQSRTGQMGDNTYAGQNPPYVQSIILAQRDRAHLVNTPLITFYLGAGATGTATLEIAGADGRSRKLSLPAKAGITRYAWDGRFDGAPGSTPQGQRGGRGTGGGAAAAVAGGATETVGEGGGGQGGRGAGTVRPTPGTYSLKLTLGDSTATGTLVLRADPLLRQ